MTQPCTCPSMQCSEHRYSLLVAAERDIDTGAEVIRLSAPAVIEILVYPMDGQPGVWMSKVRVECIDVDTGEPGSFGSEWQIDHKPTKAEIARQLADMLHHEILEQLGCDPHGVSRPTDPTRLRR